MLNFQRERIKMFSSYINVLKKCPLFDNIAPDDIVRILTCFGAKVEHFDKKYTVFAEGYPAKHLGIVLSGSVQVTQVDYYGNRNILSVMGSSEIFAEAFACVGIDSLPVSVVAGEPCEVLLIDRERILHTCAGNCEFHRQIIFNLMKDLALKTIMFHQRIDITSKRTTRDKLLTYLTLQAKKSNSRSFDIPFDRQELADYLEVERSGLSAEISKLRNEGVLESTKNHFTLHGMDL